MFSFEMNVRYSKLRKCVLEHILLGMKMNIFSTVYKFFFVFPQNIIIKSTPENIMVCLYNEFKFF